MVSLGERSVYHIRAFSSTCLTAPFVEHLNKVSAVGISQVLTAGGWSSLASLKAVAGAVVAAVVVAMVAVVVVTVAVVVVVAAAVVVEAR